MPIFDINRFQPNIRQDNRQRQMFAVENSETLKGIGQFSDRLLDTTLNIMDQNKKIEQNDFAMKVFSDFEIKNAQFDTEWEARVKDGAYTNDDNETYLTAKMKFFNRFKQDLRAKYGGSYRNDGLLAFVDSDLTGKITDKTVTAIKKNYDFGVQHVKGRFENITEESKRLATELDYSMMKGYYEGKFLDDINTLHKQTNEINPVYAERMKKAAMENMSSMLAQKATDIDMTRNSVIDVNMQISPLSVLLSENKKQYNINFLKEYRERPDFNYGDQAKLLEETIGADYQAHDRAISRLEQKGVGLDQPVMQDLIKSRDNLLNQLNRAKEINAEPEVQEKAVDKLEEEYSKSGNVKLDMEDMDIEYLLSDARTTPDGKELSTNLIWDNLPSGDRLDYFKKILSAKLAGTKSNHDNISRLIDEAKAIGEDYGDMTTTVTGRKRLESGFNEIVKIVTNPDNRDYVEKNTVKVAQDLFESSLNHVVYRMLIDPSSAKRVNQIIPQLSEMAISKIRNLNDPMINAIMDKNLVGNKYRGQLNKIIQTTKRKIEVGMRSGKLDPMRLAAMYGGDELNASASMLSKNFTTQNLNNFYNKFNTSLGDYTLSAKHPEIITGMLDHFINGSSEEIEAISLGLSRYKSFSEHYQNTLAKMAPELRVKIIERGILKGNSDEKSYYSTALVTDFFNDKSNGAFVGELIGPSSPQVIKQMQDSLTKDPELRKDYENIAKYTRDYLRKNVIDGANSPEAIRAVGATVSNYILNQRMSGKLSDRGGLQNAVNETFKKLYEYREPLATSFFKGTIRRKPNEDRSQLQDSLSKVNESFHKDLEAQIVGVNLDSLITSADITSRGETLENFNTKKGRYKFLRSAYNIRLQPLDDSGRDRRVEGVLIDKKTGAVIKLRNAKGKAAIYEVP